VGCSSPGLGKGSTFVITLPLLLEEAPDLLAPQVNAPVAVMRLKVLVVDDNIDAAEMLGLLLAAQGHDVAIEHGALGALARARSMRPDVCLLDIGLPDIDGHELARRLQQDPGMADSVLVAVTGYGQPQDRDAALAAGFAHHLVKPLDVEVLLEVLAGVPARTAGPQVRANVREQVGQD